MEDPKAVYYVILTGLILLYFLTKYLLWNLWKRLRRNKPDGKQLGHFSMAPMCIIPPHRTYRIVLPDYGDRSSPADHLIELTEPFPFTAEEFAIAANIVIGDNQVPVFSGFGGGDSNGGGASSNWDQPAESNQSNYDSPASSCGSDSSPYDSSSSCDSSSVDS